MQTHACHDAHLCMDACMHAGASIWTHRKHCMDLMRGRMHGRRPFHNRAVKMAVAHSYARRAGDRGQRTVLSPWEGVASCKHADCRPSCRRNSNCHRHRANPVWGMRTTGRTCERICCGCRMSGTSNHHYTTAEWEADDVHIRFWCSTGHAWSSSWCTPGVPTPHAAPPTLA